MEIINKKEIIKQTKRQHFNFRGLHFKLLINDPTEMGYFIHKFRFSTVHVSIISIFIIDRKFINNEKEVAHQKNEQRTNSNNDR